MEGFFFENKLINGRIIDLQGNIEEGEFFDGYLTGKGKRINIYGTIEQGEFCEGNLHGMGKRTDPKLK